MTGDAPRVGVAVTLASRIAERLKVFRFGYDQEDGALVAEVAALEEQIAELKALIHGYVARWHRAEESKHDQ